MKHAVLLAFLGACGGTDPCAGVKVEPAATLECVDDLAVAGYLPAGPCARSAIRRRSTPTFFQDSPVNAQARMETHLHEPIDVIDQRFQ
jgi:hypothetical protein